MANQQTKRALAPGRDQHAEVESRPDQPARQNLFRRQPGRQVQNGRTDEAAEQLANGLGWFSIGLGLTELIAPRGLARLIGAEGKHTLLIRLMGLREITAGVGILANRRPKGWVWARVAGDTVDLALLTAACLSPKADRGRLTAVSAAVVGVTALDIYNAQKLSSRPGEHGGLSHVETITIGRSPEEVYQFWHNLENLPRFMSYLESVTRIDEKRSHWVAKSPAGAQVEWDAETVEDRPNQLISWRSLPGSDIETYGSVIFTPAPGNRGTEITVELEYNPPGGALGAGIAKIFGQAPEQMIRGDLPRLKQVLEVGEIVNSDSSIHMGPHPAQPPEDVRALSVGALSVGALSAGKGEL